MGVGNYMFRHTEMPQTCLSIDAVEVSFEEVLEESFDRLMTHLRSHPEDAPAGFDPDAWGVSDLGVLCQKIIDRDVWSELVEDGVAYGMEAYYQAASDATWDDLRGWVIGNLNELGVKTFEHTVWSEHHYPNRDNYEVLGRGKFCEVGIKSWEHMIYVGAQPTYAVDTYEDSITKMCSSEQSKQWQQRLASLALLVQPDNAEFKEVAGKALIQFPDHVREHFAQRVDAYCTPVRVIDELIAKAEDALEGDTVEQFLQDYGFDASEVLQARDELFELHDVWVEVNHLPLAVQAGYAKEYAAMADAIKRACFECTSEVYSSNGGYTSTKVQPPEPKQQAQAAPQAAEHQVGSPSLG